MRLALGMALSGLVMEGGRGVWEVTLCTFICAVRFVDDTYTSKRGDVVKCCAALVLNPLAFCE